jgi:RNA polymerase sigma-70 factor (ECF subfamily)
MQAKTELPLQEMALKFVNSRTEVDFTRLYYRMKPGISMYLREMIPSRDDREEVIATTFAKVWIKIDQYDSYYNFSTWVYRIARNEALLFFRAKRRTYSYDAMEEMGINMESKLEPTNPEYFDEELPASDQLHDLVLDEIRSLPQMYKDVLTLREVEKKKYEEIADQLGWKLNTVRTRIHKARRIIRSEIGKKAPALLKHYQESL